MSLLAQVLERREKRSHAGYTLFQSFGCVQSADSSLSELTITEPLTQTHQRDERRLDAVRAISALFASHFRSMAEDEDRRTGAD